MNCKQKFIEEVKECFALLMNMAYFTLPWMLMCDEQGLLYPTLDAGVMVGAASTTLPLRGKVKGIILILALI